MIGEIRLFAGNFAPKNWSFCQGQTINIASNSALFSILGVTYGGNGTTNFLLPNLASRACIGAGNGPGLTPYALGETGGLENVTLNLTQMPAHTHMANGAFAPFVMVGTADESNPTGGYAANSTLGDVFAENGSIPMGPSPIDATISNTGGNQPHSNVQPFLGMNYVICMYGIYPSRG